MFVVIIAMTTLSSEKKIDNTYYAIADLGISLQSEFLLASKVENGYQRIIFIPSTINGNEYELSIVGQESNSYLLEFKFNELDFTYKIPRVNGTIQFGENIITKENDTVFIYNE